MSSTTAYVTHWFSLEIKSHKINFFQPYKNTFYCYKIVDM